MKRALVLTLLLGLSALGYAQYQPASFNQQFLEANQLLEEKLWVKSLDAWLQLYNQDPSNFNVNYKVGYCYLNMANDKLKSLPYLEQAASNITKKYAPYDPTEKRAPVEALYYLGLAYHLNYQMDMAIEKFEQLKSKVPAKHRLHTLSEREIEMCNEAIYQVNNPKNYVISNVGGMINTMANEYSPVLSLDENTMFFTSRRIRPDSSNAGFEMPDTGELREDVYQSFRGPDGNWTAPEMLNINRDSHSGSVSVSPDGQTLFVYYDEEGNGQLYQSRLIGETWSEPELLGSDINSDAWETHASIAADGKTLYFVSDREEGGYGGRDIYRCVKLPNDEWSKALNLGTTINTEWDEDAVFVSPDNNTLYFSSNGHESMGGFDIFYSRRGPDGEWSKPANMGYPLNTVDDDVFFYPTADSKRAYYSSRKDEGFGFKDIYVIDMPDAQLASDMAVLKGYIIAAEGEDLPDDCLVVVTNLTTGEVTEYRPRARDGAYVAVLEPCNEYHIEYFANQEMVHEEDMNIPCESSYSEIEKEIFLLPVELRGDETSLVDEPTDNGAATIDEPSFDPNNPINTIIADGQAYYERYFVYDSGEYDPDERNFVAFLEAVVNMHEAGSGAKVIIDVESSASEVPSSRFKNNQELTKHRNKLATKQITQELQKRGLKKGRDFKFAKGTELVQGPDYENDAWRRAKYEPFQYIKARAAYQE